MSSLSNNPLTNKDLAPTTPEQRTWSWWHLAALWVGMSVCIPTYMLAGGMIDQGMNWWQAVLTVMAGNVIVLVPMILNGHGGTKYGIPFPVLARASFGTDGAHVASVARALVACGWFGIQTWIGGSAIYQILGAVNWIDVAADTEPFLFLGITLREFGCFLGFWALNLGVILAGINCIKWLETWAAPFLLAMGIALLVWALMKVDDVGALFSQSSTLDTPGKFWAVFFPQLTAMVGFWATLSLNIPDFTRYCRSQRDQALGQIVGLPTTMTLFCFIGIVVTAATMPIFGETIGDPVALVSRMGSPAVVVLSLVVLSIATLSTNIAANVVSPANSFSNLWPRGIGFTTGGLITCLIGVVIMPWYLYNDLGAYIFTWLIGYGALLGPVAGIMLCDYFLVRRTELDLEGLYEPSGPYRGVNWCAIVTLVVAVLPNIPGFVNALRPETFPAFFSSIYSYAWFIGLTIAVVLYYVLMQASKGTKA